MAFLPITKKELEGKQLDFIMVSGDAYVDHPSFGHAVISRLFEAQGFSVGIIAQPQKDYDYTALGEPKIGFLMTTGVVDSMVNNYTASKKKRHNDEYSPGNQGFRRPDRAFTVYCKNLKRLYPEVAIIGGGSEGSLRRFAHYDYWADAVMPSVVYDSGCDLVIYGAGEKPVIEICDLIKKGIPVSSIKDVKGTCYITSFDTMPKKVMNAMKGDRSEFIQIESFQKVLSDKKSYAKAFKTQTMHLDAIIGKGIIQEQKDKKFLVQNSPSLPMTVEEMDNSSELNYERQYHPSYEKDGGVKALEEVKFSITSHRGCYGNCSFCSITYHMGRRVQKRSSESIVREAELITKMPDFKGYIHDVGGPSANFRETACDKQIEHGVCTNKECIGTKACENLNVDHSEYLEVLRALRKIPRVKKVFIRSGIRFDYLMMDKNPEFFNEMVKYHISGQLKTAPEHASNNVLKLMNKPDFSVYKNFTARYNEANQKLGLNQFIVPYFIASHPGTTISDAVELTKYLKSINYMPLQVQDFYPTPSTRSTCMFYTGIDPNTMETVHVPTADERLMQRALLQYRKPENESLVRHALLLTGNHHLIGNGPDCIVRADIKKANVGARPTARKSTKTDSKSNLRPNVKKYVNGKPAVGRNSKSRFK